MHKQIHPKSLYWGNTVILLNTIDAAGSTNITPISSSWALSNNIVIGLSLNIKAIENIESCPEVVLNIASANLVNKIESIARYTGKQPVPPEKLKSGFSYCEDKFLIGEFTAQPSKTVQPLRIQECALQVECLVENVIKRDKQRDDLMSMVMAISKIKNTGNTNLWVAKSGFLPIEPKERQQIIDTVLRGFAEVEQYLKKENLGVNI